MTPRPESHHGETMRQESTVVVEPQAGAAYVVCNASRPFVNPTVTTKSAKQVNATLNLNLGLPINPNNVRLRKFLRWLNEFFLMWWEQYFYVLWDKVPLIVRQKITFWAWKVYLPLHRYLLGRKTGIHPAASEEYHAMTTVMWWGRLFPVSIERMRFALSQLSVWHPRKGPDYCNVDHVQYDMEDYLKETSTEIGSNNTKASGYYVQCDDASSKVMFWLYGGAYLAGDARGNVTIAESVAQQCNVNVFLPQFGLMPENDYNDILWDVLLAYVYLVRVRGVDPNNVVFLGISSGGGLVTRCLQAIAEVNRNDPDFECKHIYSLLSNCLKEQPMMPSGAVLVCPFVDYTDSKGAFEEYPAHDLIVNQSVIEVGVPYFQIKLGSMENRKRTSPVFRSFEGLPPLCVILSEHEVVYDQAVELVNRARSQNISVTVGVWKYMCHVFCFLSTFIPEGEQAMDFCCTWIRQHYKQGKK